MKHKAFNPYKDGLYPSTSLILTIGCNVDGKPALLPNEVWSAAHEKLTAKLSYFTTEEGEWEGIPETSVSVHVEFVHSYYLEQFLQEVETLADALKQDAIGVWDLYGGSTLVYGSKWHAKQNAQKNA